MREKPGQGDARLFGTAGRHGFDDVIGKQGGGRLVALGHHGVGQRDRHEGGIVPFTAVLVLDRHGGADVDQQVGNEVGFQFVLFGVIAARLEEQPPIQMPQIIAGHILPVACEFNRKAVERGAVVPHQGPLHPLGRLEADRRNTCHGVRVQVFDQMLGMLRHK